MKIQNVRLTDCLLKEKEQLKLPRIPKEGKSFREVVQNGLDSFANKMEDNKQLGKDIVFGMKVLARRAVGKKDPISWHDDMCARHAIGFLTTFLALSLAFGIYEGRKSYLKHKNAAQVTRVGESR